MKNMFRLLAVVGVLSISAFGAEEDIHRKNERLTAELKELRMRANALSTENEKEAKTIRVLGFTRELMDGTRKTPPKVRVVEEVVYEGGWDKPIFFDCTEKTKPDMKKWMALKPGSTYQFTCEVKGENIQGGEGAQFQSYIPVLGGSPFWYGSKKTGTGSFDWRKMSFRFVMPHGGSFMFLFGPNKSTGRIWYRNIRGVELKEIYE